MPNQPSQSLAASEVGDSRRTIFAFVCAGIISAAVLALVLIFDIK
jgi:hypothetical protein